MMPFIAVDGRREPLEISESSEFRVPANRGYTISGLDVGSEIAVREYGDHEWRGPAAHADSHGRLLDAGGRKALATHEQGGERFDIRVCSAGAEVVFTLYVEYVHGLSERDIASMLRDLRSAGYRWDRGSPIPTRTSDLVEHVELLERIADGFVHDVAAIVRAPDTILVDVEALSELKTIRRMAGVVVRKNVREGRIGPDGSPLSDRLRAVRQEPSIDSGANAYVAVVVGEANSTRSELKAAVDQERQRIRYVRQRDEQHFRDGMPRERTVAYGNLERRLEELDKRLAAMDFPELPGDWRDLRREADPTANAVLFDPRYRSVHDRRLRLRRKGQFGSDRLHRLAAFGKRSHDQIYEYWVVAKIMDVLQQMGFGSIPGGSGVAESGESLMRSLEVEIGDTYQLRSGGSVHIRHRAASHLAVALAYEPAIDQLRGEKTYRPDIAMVLRGPEPRSTPKFDDARYRSTPLFVDAKFRDLQLGDETFGYLKKYADLRHDAQVHLAHLGDHERWARRSSTDGDELFRQFGVRDRVLEGYYPYRVGFSTLRPTDDADMARAMTQALTRVLFSWLVRVGVVCVCPRCGAMLDLADKGVDARVPFTKGKAGVPTKRRLVCRTCGLMMVATYCSSCRRAEVFTPIIKVYPRRSDEDEPLTEDWSRDFEIAERTSDFRNRLCPRCGRGFGG